MAGEGYQEQWEAKQKWHRTYGVLPKSETGGPDCTLMVTNETQKPGVGGLVVADLAGPSSVVPGDVDRQMPDGCGVERLSREGQTATERDGRPVISGFPPRLPFPVHFLADPDCTNA